MITMILIMIIKKYFPELAASLILNIRNFNLLKMIPRFLFVSLVFTPAAGFTQQNTYSVFKGNKNIGTLSVKQLKNDDQIIYSIRSQAKTGFIFNIIVNVNIDEVFDMREMQHSTFTRKINGIETMKNIAEKTNGGYKINNDEDDESKFLPGKITYSMASMYFIEPINLNSVYSENYQKFIPVVTVGKNCYLIKFPDGNKSYYTYNNGICTKVEAHTNWAILFFKINEEPSLNAVFSEIKY